MSRLPPLTLLAAATLAALAHGAAAAPPEPAAPAAAVSAPAAIDADERLRRLEEAFQKQAARLSDVERELEVRKASDRALLKPSGDEASAAVTTYLNAAPKDVVAVESTEGSGGLHWGGYFSLVYSDRSDTNSRFDNTRLVLAADGAITPFIDFDMELEIEHGGIADAIDGEIELEKAEVSFHVSDAFVPKIGWLLVPFGRFNAYHDDPLNDFSTRPFTARFLVPTGFGQPGIGFEGAMPLSCAGHVLSYSAALTNGFRDNFSAARGTRDAVQSTDENDGKQAWARAAVTWKTCVFDYLETGLSGTGGIYDLDDERTITGYALDFLVRKGPFEAKGEYVAYQMERNAADPVDAIEGMWGLWLEAAYHFYPGFWACGNPAFTTDTSLFTLAVRYQSQDLHDRYRGLAFEDDLDAYSVGLNYRITERTLFRVDHTWFRPSVLSDETEWTFSFSTFL